MSKFLVTLGASTGPGSVMQCASVTATINKKPIAVVGDIATHPYGPDTLIEGIPTILLNGKPVAFSTAKTSMGGALVPNTSVKISSPTFESYTGIVHSARVVSELTFEEAESEKMLKQQIAAREEEEPVKSGEFSLKSDFAWKQLIDLAGSDGKWFFKFRMADIFGKDVSQSAVDKLHDACMDKSLPNPEIEVCENTIHGLSAAYNTKTNKIYVSRQMVEAAVEDNEIRHKLLAALVEEFGHHVDWLLRCKYDTNAKQDAEGDEGARFAYQGMCRVLYLDFHELQNVPFAEAQTPKGAFSLDWDIADAHDALEKYTKDRQYGTDDHVGDYEGFKVEDLSKKGGFGHENIQRDAILRSNVKPLRDKINMQYLYRGNWLKDYSQLIAPIFFDPLAVWGKEADGTLKDYYDKLMPDVAQTKDFLTDVVRVLVIDEYHNGESRYTIARKDYYQDPLKWRNLVGDEKNGLLPGFDDLIGVSVPYDHCDNPKGLPASKRLEEAGFNKAITDDELSVDKQTGIKHYIRSSQSGMARGTKVVYDELAARLGKVDFSRPADLTRLGGVLHTVQDFYAHSNFAETYLAKVWFDKVVTWCAASDRERDYSRKRVAYYDTDLNNLQFTEPRLRGILESKGKFISRREQIVWASAAGRAVNKKAFYTPIVTGTYDMEDLLSTALIMLSEKRFSLEPAPPKRKMEAGVLYANDLFLLLVARYFDATVLAGKDSAETALNLYFDMRDKWIRAKQFVEECVPDWLRKPLEWLDATIAQRLEQTLRVCQNILMHYLIILLARSVKEYQLLLKEQLDNFGENAMRGLYKHGDNPSHTMLAKDDTFHPLNELAGEMAVGVTTDILMFLNDKVIGKQAAKNIFDAIFRHPLQTERFDTFVLDWAKKNPVAVLRCCVYSEALENIRMKIQLTASVKLKIDKRSGASATVGANRAARSSNDKDALSQKEDLNRMGTSHKSLKASLKQAVDAYVADNGGYRELDAQTFADFMTLYHPEIKDSEAAKEHLKKIWREEASKRASGIVSSDISVRFSFVGAAYQRAETFIRSYKQSI